MAVDITSALLALKLFTEISEKWKGPSGRVGSMTTSWRGWQAAVTNSAPGAQETTAQILEDTPRNKKQRKGPKRFCAWRAPVRTKNAARTTWDPRLLPPPTQRKTPPRSPSQRRPQRALCEWSAEIGRTIIKKTNKPAITSSRSFCRNQPQAEPFNAAN